MRRYPFWFHTSGTNSSVLQAPAAAALTFIMPIEQKNLVSHFVFSVDLDDADADDVRGHTSRNFFSNPGSCSTGISTLDTFKCGCTCPSELLLPSGNCSMKLFRICILSSMLAVKVHLARSPSFLHGT